MQNNGKRLQQKDIALSPPLGLPTETAFKGGYTATHSRPSARKDDDCDIYT